MLETFLPNSSINKDFYIDNDTGIICSVEDFLRVMVEKLTTANIIEEKEGDISNMTKKKAFFIIGITAILIAFLLSACDLFKPLMSDKEMETRLQELYGEEFVVVSSKSFPTDDTFRARVYVASPKDEPEFAFYAYNFIESETGGVPGVKHSFTDTYAEKKIQTKFDEYATAEDLKYTTEHFISLGNKKIVSEGGSDYYTNVVNIFTVTPETLDNVSYKLSMIFNKIIEEEHFLKNISSRCGMKFFYVENGKEKNVRYFTLFAYGWNSNTASYDPVDISEEGIKKIITGEDAYAVTETTVQEVPYVFIDLNLESQKLTANDKKTTFTVISASSTYLPVGYPYNNKSPSKLFPKSNYFLLSANLEVEGQFLFTGTLQKSDDLQYDGWWTFTLTEDSAKAFPQISEVSPNNVIYLSASVAESATAYQDEIVEISLTRLFITYGQGDIFNMGS